MNLEIDLSGGIAGDDVNAAVDASLGALLLDRDVTEITALEGGFLEVLRRGKRERLDAVLEGPLFALLREEGADKNVVRLKLRGGQRLVCGPLVDGRTALRIEKSAPIDATLEALVQEGVLPPGVSAELIAAVLEGAGLLVLGPSRTARQRTVAAVVRALQGRVAWFGCTESLSSLVPVPLERSDVPAPPSVLDRARAAVQLGADAVCGLEIEPIDLAALARASLGVPVVASVTSSSMEALAAALDVPVSAVAGQSAVIGHAPDGRPRLVELHGPPRAVDGMPDASAAGSGGTSSSSAGAAVTSNASATSSGARARNGESGAGGASGGQGGPIAARGSAGDAVRGTVVGAAAAADPARSSARSLQPSSAFTPAEVSGLRERPSRAQAGGNVDDPLPPLDALPPAWASDAPDDDPGWELGDPPPPSDATESTATAATTTTTAASAPPAPGSFDAALAAKKTRPSFAPRPPPAHPQTQSLRGDPFGGLTFEPPPGGPTDDDVEEGDE